VSADLQDLYQEVILDHHRQPRNFGVLEGARQAEAYNRLCGDRVSVYVRVDGDVISDVSFQGTGCAISIASASLMTECVKGKTAGEARTLFGQLRQMLAGLPGAPVDGLGALTPLAGVRQFPIRVKCATLAWQALQDALDGVTS
jgi:nitrogen fixation NifU-like protein